MWVDGTLLRVPDPNYADSMEARMYTSDSSNGPWTLAVSHGPSDDVTVKSKDGKITAPERGPDLYVRLELQPTLSGGGVLYHTPVVTGYQVSAIPAPSRSRLVAIPIQVFDFEKDRNGAQTGSEGYAWQRLSALEGMESDYPLVQYTDNTTGESRQVYVERVTFTRMTPPFRGDNNAGGVATVLLRIVG
jgi:hypothetical protein